MKNRTVQLAAFNIVTHPHSEKSYADIFKRARELKQIIKIWGDTHALLCSALTLNEFEKSPITGEVYTFFDIDPNEPWFDILKGEAASDKETKEVKIPSHLRPHLKRIRYVFFPDRHTFVYVRSDSVHGRISPKSMQEFLTALLNDNRILAKVEFQAVEVRLVQDKQSLKKIFQSPRVERLDISIRKPNGDTGGEAQQSVEQELDEQNLEEYFVSQKAAKGKSIQPNKRTVRLMEEATLNGFVEAKVWDENDMPHTVNTSSKPLVAPVKIDPEASYIGSIVRAGRALLDKI